MSNLYMLALFPKKVSIAIAILRVLNKLHKEGYKFVAANQIKKRTWIRINVYPQGNQRATPQEHNHGVSWKHGRVCSYCS